MAKTILVFFLALQASSALAQTAGLDSIQMQRLIEATQQQLKATEKLLAEAQRDSASLEKASSLLDQMAKGIDHEIKPLQGTPIYNQALLKLQNEPSGAVKSAAEPVAGESEEQGRVRQNFTHFQEESHRADMEDMANQGQISEALINAPPGFVPKLQTQAELGQWQTQVRISAQLTELLAAIHGLRKDLNKTQKDGKPEGFGLFLMGAAEQSSKLKGGMNRVP